MSGGRYSDGVGVHGEYERRAPGGENKTNRFFVGRYPAAPAVGNVDARIFIVAGFVVASSLAWSVGARDVYATVVVDDVVSYWTCDEESGTRADSNGTNDLTDNNTVTFGTGIIGNSCDFNQPNSEYLNTTSTTLNPTGDYSVSLWVKSHSTQQLRGIYSTDGGGGGFNLYQNSGDLIWVHQGVDSVTCKSNATVNIWYHIVATYNATNDELRCYVDAGTPTENLAIGFTTNTAGLVLGAYAALSYYWDGELDEVAQFDVELTAQDVTDLFNDGAGFAYPFTYTGGGGTGTTTATTTTTLESWTDEERQIIVLGFMIMVWLIVFGTFYKITTFVL